MLIDFVIVEMLPYLYSFDIFNIKFTLDLKEKDLFKIFEKHIHNRKFNSYLMRLRISHVDLSGQFQSILALI